ncbi:MAG: hypothetical protein U5R06_05050 [candidate division KSB1 bacterium]|nr:hypothetical protein [candidate division KSB1 bacterium]
MKVFNLKTMPFFPYEQRDKNVFHRSPEFKARIIELPPGGSLPDCDMDSFVVFTVIQGTATVNVNGKESRLHAGECLITEPARLSMKTQDGVRIMGLQIIKKQE